MSSTPDRRALLRRVLIAAGVFGLAFLTRAAVISWYATSIPFADQWDGELWTALRPYVSGTLGWHDLVQPHNEHRIALARLLSLGTFIANGNTWDNYVGTLVTAVLYSALYALVAVTLAPQLPWRRWWPFWIAFLAVVAVPYDWENTLSSMQSPFVLFVACTYGAVWIAATRPPGLRMTLALVLLVIGAALSVGSGVVAVPAIAVAVALRARREGAARTPLLVLGAALTAVVVVCVLTRPVVSFHSGLQPDSLADATRALFGVLSWPLRPLWIAPLVWLPCAAGLWFALRERAPTTATICACAIAAWTLIQVLAVVLVRGHGVVLLSSRYTDFMACGLLVNAYFVAALSTASTPSRLRTGTAALYVVAVVAGLAWYYAGALPHLSGNARNNRLRETTVQSVLLGRPTDSLRRADANALPYADIERFVLLMDDPGIRTVLGRGRSDFARMSAHGLDAAPDGAPLTAVAQFVLRRWMALSVAWALALGVGFVLWVRMRGGTGGEGAAAAQG